MARGGSKIGEQVSDPVSLFGRIALDSCGEPFAHHLHTVVAAISRRSGLLPPGLIERTSIDRIKTSIVHKCHDELLRLEVVTRHSDGQTIWRSFGTTKFCERIRQNIVKGLDDRTAELPRYPNALCHSFIDLRDPRIAHSWIVVAGIDNGNIF